MTASERQDQPAESGQLSADELEERLAHTRQDLGETVEALSGKLDVSSRVRTRVGTSRDAAVARAGSLRNVVREAATRDGSVKLEVLVGAGAGTVAALIVTAVVLRRRGK